MKRSCKDTIYIYHHSKWGVLYIKKSVFISHSMVLFINLSIQDHSLLRYYSADTSSLSAKILCWWSWWPQLHCSGYLFALSGSVSWAWPSRWWRWPQYWLKCRSWMHRGAHYFSGWAVCFRLVVYWWSSSTRSRPWRCHRTQCRNLKYY